MKALVTGGAGFIGSHVVEALMSDGVEVSVLDNLSIGLRQNLPEGIEFHHGSILDRELVSRLVKSVDIVYHMACVTLPVSLTEPVLSHEVNANGSLVILEAIRASDTRLVHISTSEVYGNAIRPAMDEDHPLRPRTPYAGSKLAGEGLAHAYFATFDLPIVIVRPFNAFGPRNRGPFVFPNFTTALLTGGEPGVNGTGEQTRDYTYVEDTARGIINIGDAAKSGSIVNVGSGNELSVLEILDAVCASLEIPVRSRQATDRPGDVSRMKADTSLANSLGWKPEWSFAKGVDKTVNYWKEALDHGDIERLQAYDPR